MKKILIFGGTGFIGLNLVRYLLKSNKAYNITLVGQEKVNESQKKICIFLSVAATKLPKNISISQGDITNPSEVKELVKNHNVIINLAGYSGAVNSLEQPKLSVEINTIGHLNILEAAKEINKNAVIILSSSRLEYGKPTKLPVSSNHPLNPTSIYAITKYSAAAYSGMYHKLYGLNTIVFRISNPFGQQLQPTSTSYNLVNHFIHLALENKVITLFGEGKQKRDYIHVDDLCSAFVAAFDNKKLYGSSLNIGSGKGTSMRHMAQLIIKCVGKGKISFVKWPSRWKALETGDFYFNIAKSKKQLQWRPLLNLKQAIMTITSQNI